MTRVTKHRLTALDSDPHCSSCRFLIQSVRHGTGQQGGTPQVKRLENRRILIVGASSGIGRAAAPVIAAEGARVALAARREERLKEIADEIPGGTIE